MKVLILNTYDITGGAAMAGYRLHRSLLNNNIESKVLVQNKDSGDYTVITETRKFQKAVNKVRPLLDSLAIRFYENRTKTLFSPSMLPFSGIIDKINELQPDIVHIHWICNGMLKLEDLLKIKVPIVWSLHDMWAFTGGCHYDEFCGQFQENCSNCKVLGTNNNILSKRGLKNKESIYKNIQSLSFIPTSKWIEAEAKKSIVSKYLFPIMHNPLDTKKFKPSPKDCIRDYFNISKEKKVILFGASGPFSDLRKGFNELKAAFELLDPTNIVLLIVGSRKPEKPWIKDFEIVYIPYLKDEISLPLIYNVSDVTVVPSLQETFGQISSESLSCGTPVVGFATTGTEDIVDHRINGYLASPFSSKDLAIGIQWVLGHKDYNSLCSKAREKVLREFDSDVVAKKYIELYNDILKKH